MGENRVPVERLVLALEGCRLSATRKLSIFPQSGKSGDLHTNILEALFKPVQPYKNDECVDKYWGCNQGHNIYHNLLIKLDSVDVDSKTPN